MSKRAVRRRAPSADSVERRLARLLESTELARIVPRLPPETLHQLIRHRGLDACEALVTAATPEQLTAILDLDLWQSTHPGLDAEFDAERFGEWFDMLAAMDPGTAAGTVATIDPALVGAGLTRHVRVFDLAALTVSLSASDEPVGLGIASAGGLRCEVGGYALIAKRTDAWEPIVTVLSALAAERADAFQEIMGRCRRASDSEPESDGLDDLFTAPVQLLHDVAIEREARRAELGYVPEADARAFLRMARGASSLDEPMPANPIAAAYFRASDESAVSAAEGSANTASQSAPAPLLVSDALPAAIELLAEAGLLPEQSRAQLSEGSIPSPVAHIRQLMAHLHELSASSFAMRSREVAFLANALAAGASLQSRAFTPAEAADGAVAICNLGLEGWPGSARETFLVDHDLVRAFQRGWAILHRDVSLLVGETLLEAVTELHPIDLDIEQGLLTLRRTLVTHLKAGTPWLAAEALDVLATLDITAWASLVGLLGECPVIPEALQAILDRRSTPVSATAFQFISTSRHLDLVRAFVLDLPAVFRS